MQAASAGTIAWPEDLHVISSVAEWAALHASAHRDGALLATVFMSQAALPAYWPGLRSLMRAVGGGVRFAFVEVGAGYYQRVVEAKVPSLAADPADPAGPWAALDVDVALAKLANRRSHTVPGACVCWCRTVGFRAACRVFSKRALCVHVRACVYVDGAGQEGVFSCACVPGGQGEAGRGRKGGGGERVYSTTRTPSTLAPCARHKTMPNLSCRPALPQPCPPGLVVCGGRSVNGACRGFFAERDLPDYHQCVGDLTFLNGLLAGRC